MRGTLLFVFILLVTVGYGQIVTDRPDQTESSSTVERGALQIEAGVQASYFDEPDLVDRQITFPSVLVRYGLFKGIELRLVSQLESNKAGRRFLEGIGDLELGTKVQVLQKEDVNTEIAFLSHLIIPSGTEEVSADRYGVVNKLSISHELNERLGLGYNVGYDYVEEGSGDITYSLSLGVSVNDKVGMYFEPYGALVDLEEDKHYFDAGVTYLLFPNFQLDISFGVGLNEKMNYVAAGFSWKAMGAERKEK